MIGVSRMRTPKLLTREKLDTLWHDGILYEPKNCTPEEIKVLKQYAKNSKLELYTREYFVKNILYRSHWVKKAAKWKDDLREPCLVIGQNLPFDLGALAMRCGLAIKDLYGGLSLKMQGVEGEYGRSVAIKKIGFGKHLFRGTKTQNGCFTASGKTGEDTLSLSSGRARTMELVEYLDTQTLARALLGPGPSGMQALLDRLNVPKEFQKKTADYHGPITAEYIGYCRSDVENTWQIFRALRELYNKHGRSRPMQKVYSEASLGKAYLDDFGIQGFNKLNPAFDQVALGCFMETYYGGRSEVHVRHESVEVIHYDFKAEYSTVNALMDLQELLTAKQIGLKTDSPDSRAFLENVTLTELQRKETWKKLRGIALIEPDDDILPFRAQYGETEDDGAISVNIGINRVISACPAWYTFADIIASKLLTGRTPKILKTLELYAIGRQTTQTIKLFGEDRYTIDLSKDDFFTTVIDARIDVQNDMKGEALDGDRKSFLSSLEKALKLLASATSYGVLVEFIADDRLKEVPTTVYHGGLSTKVTARKHHVGMDGTTEISDYKVETAGKFFAPFGTLIPAAGRLFLAIAERLAADRGLTYAFCDTDSMAFCDYHKKYSKGCLSPVLPLAEREEFRAKTREIADWFQPLKPYKHDVRLFNLEDANYRLADKESGKITKEFEPLYCLAISAKRYCLFNRGTNGEIIIRKASAHGLGDVMLPTGYIAKFEHFAAPKNSEKVRVHGKLIAGSGAALFLDMWHTAITELDAKGTLDGVDKTICSWPELDVPQHSQTTLSTRDAWLHYSGLPNRRAFQFMTTLPAPILNPFKESAGLASLDILMPELHEARNSSLYMPFTKPFKLDLKNLFRRDNNELIKPYLDAGLDLVTVSERVEKYFNHGEAKSQGTTGLLSRKCVAGLSKIWIGKESHPLADTEDLPDDETLEHYRAEARIVGGSLSLQASESLTKISVNHELIARAGIARVAKAARVDKTMLEKAGSRLATGKKEAVSTKKKLSADMMARIAKAISILPDASIKIIEVPPTRQETIADRVRKILANGKLRELARFIHSDLARKLSVSRHAGVTKAHEDPMKYETLLRGVSNASQGSDNTQLRLAEIEAYARKFYGIDARLAKKAEKENKLANMRASTAHNVRARLDKLRLNRRSKEINRVAEFWAMPEIANAATVKHAHLIDRFLNQIAVKGYRPKKIICSPYLLSDQA
jgi:hypothetical protein